MRKLHHLFILSLALLALLFSTAAPLGVCLGALCCEEDADRDCSSQEASGSCVEDCALCQVHLSPVAAAGQQREGAADLPEPDLAPVTPVPGPVLFAPHGAQPLEPPGPPDAPSAHLPLLATTILRS